MGTDNDDKSKQNYNVGYGKPPKHTRFKAKSTAAGGSTSGRRRSGTKSMPEPLDLGRILNERLTVTKNGETVSMEPFEIGLRALVKSVVKDNSLPALKEIIRLALEFDLVKPPPHQPCAHRAIATTCSD